MRTITYLAVAAFVALLTSEHKLVEKTMAVLMPPATSQSTDRAISLRLKFYAGQVNTYHSMMTETGTVTQPGQPACPIDLKVDMTVTQTVQSIDPQTGAATVLTSTCVTKRTNNGKNADLTTSPEATTTITSTIEPDGIVDPPTGAADCGFFASDKPVAVGDSWSRDSTEVSSGMQCHTTFKLSGTSCSSSQHLIATVGATLTGSLLTKLMPGSATSASGTLTGDQISQVDTTLGVLRSSTVTTHSLMDLYPCFATRANATAPMSEMIDMTQTTTMTLVSSN